MEHPTSCMLFLLGGISIAMMNQTQDRLTVATLLQVRDILRVRGTCKTDLASWTKGSKGGDTYGQSLGSWLFFQFEEPLREMIEICCLRW